MCTKVAVKHQSSSVYCLVDLFVGRTMDFQFDQSQVSIIGSKLLNLSSPDDDGDGEDMNVERRFASEGASLSPGVSLNDSLNSGWKRPQLSQVRCEP